VNTDATVQPKSPNTIQLKIEEETSSAPDIEDMEYEKKEHPRK
jgi:hypothetical protein